MDLDLVAALGVPEGPPKGPGKPAEEKKGGSSYLAAKPPKLRAWLMDAVDPSLSHEERAEALCRALEEHSGAEPEEDEPDPPSAPPAPPSGVGEGFEDY